MAARFPGGGANPGWWHEPRPGAGAAGAAPARRHGGPLWGPRDRAAPSVLLRLEGGEHQNHFITIARELVLCVEQGAELGR